MQADSRGVIHYDQFAPSTSLQQNVETLKTFFSGDETVKYRLCVNDSCCLVFIDGMSSSEAINRQILEPLLAREKNFLSGAELLAAIPVSDVSTAKKYSDAVLAVVHGDTLLMRDGSGELYLFSTKGFPVRAIAEPDNEKALFGPREGFTESLLQNTTMLRRKLATTDLKIRFRTVSERTNSRACLCYLDSLVNRDILREMEKRLDGLDVDAFMDTYAITELIRDSGRSLLNTVGKSERPDTIATKLLDGGVALLLDGSPVAIFAPFLFVENFQSQDDDYIGFYYASASRILRYLAFLVTISIGAIYISMITFHSEMLPTSFMLTIASATSNLPMPTFLEFIVMMLLFEMLRETGIRMSTKLGQSLSIVGALVIGQAAVEARIISAPMVIIVAISAITGLMIPSLSSVVIIMRILAVISASFFGFYGYAFAMLGLLIHLFSLESFGIQYTANMLSFKLRDIRNTYVRAPKPTNKYRTKFVARDRKRSK